MFDCHLSFSERRRNKQDLGENRWTIVPSYDRNHRDRSGAGVARARNR